MCSKESPVMANRGGLINLKMTNKFLEVLIFSDGELVNQQYIRILSQKWRLKTEVDLKMNFRTTKTFWKWWSWLTKAEARNFSIYGNLSHGWLKRSIIGFKLAITPFRFRISESITIYLLCHQTYIKSQLNWCIFCYKCTWIMEIWKCMYEF